MNNSAKNRRKLRITPPFSFEADYITIVFLKQSNCGWKNAF